jgi:hypothetical protein
VSVRVEVQPSLLKWASARSGIDDDILVKRFPRYNDWLGGEEPPTLPIDVSGYLAGAYGVPS